jgi:hypothetical protein
MGSPIFGALKDQVLAKLLPFLAEQGLNALMPELGDLVATAIENWKKELPADVQALFP